jgi:DeoR/GlpR family transcriptional regulator of sugar metabolism
MTHSKTERQRLILDQLRRSGGTSVGELSTLLGVSESTVRRDLDALAAGGRVERVHGGAVHNSLIKAMSASAVDALLLHRHQIVTYSSTKSLTNRNVAGEP